MSEIEKRNLDHYFEIASKTCTLWGLGILTPKLICNGENVTYKVSSEKGDFCIRITRKEHRGRGQLLAELDWIGFLANHQTSVSPALKSLDGDLLHEFKKEEGVYFASVFRWAYGELFKAEENLNRDFLESLGRLVGRTHRLTTSYDGSNLEEPRKKWADSRHIDQAEEIIKQSNSKLLKYWREVRDWRLSLEASKETYGLVHTDIHTGNFHVKENVEITLFDFDDCSYNFFAYDLCIPLMSLFSVQTQEFSYEKAEQIFLSSYLKEYDLPQIWIDRIPSFVRLRNIEMYSWVNFMYGGCKTSSHLEYLKKIENSLIEPFSFV